MAVGIKPESLQLLRLKTVMLRNGVKLKLSNFPLSSKLERSICEISSLETSHTTLVQLQRLMMLLLSHVSKEGDCIAKLSFHVMRASACALGDEAIFNGSKERTRTRRRSEKQVVGTLFMYHVLDSRKSTKKLSLPNTSLVNNNNLQVLGTHLMVSASFSIVIVLNGSEIMEARLLVDSSCATKCIVGRESCLVLVHDSAKLTVNTTTIDNLPVGSSNR
ncbi:hypothetical protein G4B88_024677 [Cannabis sativa]|uniref:Uncharacterized protein n=1 Tax=Cannabis sativa TaxID=3483 RepID=A0A7J6GW38_CANSA|nr:hypothetical protein G4B88_024677 [Cannabis sativa]